MISNSPDQVTLIRAEWGYPLTVKLAFTKSDGSPMDLTGVMLLFYLRQLKHKGGAAVDVEAEITKDTPNTLGRAFLYMQGDPMKLPLGEYDFLISAKVSAEPSTVVVKGRLEVVDNANTVGTPDFTVGSSAQELSVHFTERNKIIVRTNHLPDSQLAAYTELAATNASAAGIYADEAAASAAAAAASETNAAGAAGMSWTHAQTSIEYAAQAFNSAGDSLSSADSAAGWAADSSTQAGVSTAAAISATASQAAAAASAAAAAASELAADASADAAAGSAGVAQAALDEIETFTKGDTGEQGEQGETGPAGEKGVELVFHGAVGSTARPDYALVYWIGSALPANATDYDWWLPEDVTP